MNTGSQYRYIGTLDATLKIINEGIVTKPEIPQKTSRWRDFKEQIFGIRNLYKGGFVFGLSYVAYMAVQFSLFESILLYLEKHHILEMAPPKPTKEH